MTWTSIPIPVAADPWATPYGFVIDHIWRCPGTNAARRPHWPEGMFISVEPFEDDEIEAMGCWAMTHGVFFHGDDVEYGSPADDMRATDWLVGEV